jgi:hypothetical protein
MIAIMFWFDCYDRYIYWFGSYDRYYLLLAMIPIAELAAYRDIPVFGWLSNEESLDDKTKLQTLVRSIAPLSSIGTVYSQIVYTYYFRKLLSLFC